MNDQKRQESLHTQTLLERARQGDRAAFEELFQDYRGRILRAAKLRVGPELSRHIDVEDLVHDALHSAFKDFQQYKAQDHARFIDWFSKIFDNAITNEARKQGRQKRDRRRERSLESLRPAGGSTASIPLPGKTGTPSRTAFESERNAILDACVGELSSEHRDVIRLRFYCGMKPEAISEQLGLLPNTISSRLSRAVKELRTKLGQHGLEDLI